MALVTYKNRTILDGRGALPKLEPAARLKGAMRALGGALAEQQAELAQFREKISELKDAMGDIRESLDDYAESVEQFDVEGLRDAARKLRDQTDDR